MVCLPFVVLVRISRREPKILRGSEVRAAANYHAGTVTYACRSVAYVNHLAQNCHSTVTYVLYEVYVGEIQYVRI